MPLTIALAIMSIISGIATIVAVPGFFYAAGLQRSYTSAQTTPMSTAHGDYSGNVLREDCEAIPATIKRTGVPPMSRSEMVKIINKAASDFKISPTIIAAIIRQESTYDAEAQSGVGAGGLMQFMPETWRDEYKVDVYRTAFTTLIAANSKLDPANYLDSRFNPGANVYFGTGYIKKQIDYFNGDTAKGLAAYNAGAGNVEHYGGIPPFAETEGYVAKITQSISEFEACLETKVSGNSILLDVPAYEQQLADNCVATSRIMIEDYFRIKGGIAPQLSSRFCYSGSRQNFAHNINANLTAKKLGVYAHYKEFSTAGKSNEEILSTIKGSLEKGGPVQFHFRQPIASGTNHTAVIVGYDKDRDVYLFNDPATGSKGSSTLRANQTGVNIEMTSSSLIEHMNRHIHYNEFEYYDGPSAR